MGLVVRQAHIDITKQIDDAECPVAMDQQVPFADRAIEIAAQRNRYVVATGVIEDVDQRRRG